MKMNVEELNELIEKIKIQGNKVRELKENNGSKEDIGLEVGKLIDLKNKLPKEEKKPKKIDERAMKKEQRRLARIAKSKGTCPIVKDISNESYGELPLVQSRSKDKLGRKFTEISDINSNIKEIVWIRAYIHTIRIQSKLCFLVLRQKNSTIQGVVSTKEIVKFISNYCYSESIVDIQCSITQPPSPTKAVISDIELQITKLFLVSKATPALPFQVVDACSVSNSINVNLETRLEHRTLDLRTLQSQAIIKVTAQVLHSFRGYLYKQGFTEICSPKLLGGASEGGSEVFSFDYFGDKAFLAQSPQLHKQLSCACSGLERVYEVGPVFRAENSNTNRHLCEFTGLDLEMSIKEHYHEILDTFSDLFHNIFKSIKENCSKELEVIKQFYPFEEIIYQAPEWIDSSRIVGINTRTLRIEFKEGIELLREDGVTVEEQGDFDDLSTPVEKRLGELVKKKYGVDFYFLDKFPYAPRPFYTMPCPEDERLSNSYDFFIRGQEIMSGAQRVHDPELLEKKIKEKGVPVEDLRFYIDAFKQGALPHGGGGVGLERVVMLYLALPNIRLVRMFPRDPQRLMP